MPNFLERLVPMWWFGICKATPTTASSGYDAYSIGTVSCNIGDEPLLWIPNNNQHPVLVNPCTAWPIFNGHLMEMIGQSWLKHRFCGGGDCGPCQATSCSTLGVNCSDPYTASRNGSKHIGTQVRSERNHWCLSLPPHESGLQRIHGSTAPGSSNKVTNVPSGSSFFVEGQYVCPDDNPTQGGNGDNNMSFRGVNINNGGTSWASPPRPKWLFPRSSRGRLPIGREIQAGIKGCQMIVASRSYDNEDGTWDYEYAIYNQNVDASIGGVIIPTNGDPMATSFGFACPSALREPYEPTPWSSSSLDSGIVFATESFEQAPQRQCHPLGHNLQLQIHVTLPADERSN